MIEIWASPEPTIARIDATQTRDQLVETGHAARESDIDLLADLGIAATRYPVLWEMVAPQAPAQRDYSWAARRLEALRARGIAPIVTLLHHGSGPRYTSLLDPAFPELFADYAAATARRFPWITRWTPINEPLTTARFSLLYGQWYPNLRFDHAAFGRAMVNQARAIALAVDRIRDVIPTATFMLTEDLQSFVAADETVASYVAHKRERMYLSCELLQGRIIDGHPMHAYLTGPGAIPAAELAALARTPHPPDVMGWNYYPNSERWLAGDGHGGHHNLGLIDVDPERMDMRAQLRKAHARLGLDVAFSEVHVIGDEDERARWMLQRFADAVAMQAEGIPIVGFGAWAAFGMIDWRSLLVRREHAWEDGVFTCAGPAGIPRRTRVADVVSALAAGVVPALPEQPGWFENRGDRVA